MYTIADYACNSQSERSTKLINSFKGSTDEMLLGSPTYLIDSIEDPPRKTLLMW
jgi:hypothetical protein